ncbi:MAG: exodeoxyribonuclease VII small subunit [Neisseriaceae bacterium]|nr:exodeoxyribonuclease VII small subunit [Neisseriaceae bacterium]
MPPKKNTQKPDSFESALVELESLIAQMEGGQLPLESALAAYQKGSQLLQFCQQKLTDIDAQLHLLDKDSLQTFDIE